MNGDDTGFVDIVSNLLGVFILLAMFGFLVSAAGVLTPRSRMEEPQPGFAVGRESWQLLQPFSIYYLAGSLGIFRFDLDQVAEALAQNPDRLTGVVAIGSYNLEDRRQFHKQGLRSVGRWDERDVDAFRLDVYPDWPALTSMALPESPSQALAAISAAIGQSGRVPTFLVYASGMDRFAILFEALRKHRVRFRWVAFEDTDVLRFDRSAEQFQRHDYRR
jgi:hypothetical protein